MCVYTLIVSFHSPICPIKIHYFIFCCPCLTPGYKTDVKPKCQIPTCKHYLCTCMYDYTLLKDAKNVMKAQILMIKYHQINLVVITCDGFHSNAGAILYIRIHIQYKNPLFGLHSHKSKNICCRQILQLYSLFLSFINTTSSFSSLIITDRVNWFQLKHNSSWLSFGFIPTIINFKSSTSHTSSYFPHYSAHHSSSHFLMPGARTQRSPGSSHRSCWAGCHPRTCSTTTNTGEVAPTHTSTAKWPFKKGNAHAVVSGVPSTHFHWPSNPPSVRPIHTSLSLPNKLLRNLCESKQSFSAAFTDTSPGGQTHKCEQGRTISSRVFMIARSAFFILQ